MLWHGRCYPDRCFKGSFGKVLSYCKYGFPFSTPQLAEELDSDEVRISGRLMLKLGSGFEMYLAKYCSKPCFDTRWMLCEAPQRMANSGL